MLWEYRCWMSLSTQGVVQRLDLFMSFPRFILYQVIASKAIYCIPMHSDRCNNNRTIIPYHAWYKNDHDVTLVSQSAKNNSHMTWAADQKQLSRHKRRSFSTTEKETLSNAFYPERRWYHREKGLQVRMLRSWKNDSLGIELCANILHNRSRQSTIRTTWIGICTMVSLQRHGINRRWCGLSSLIIEGVIFFCMVVTVKTWVWLLLSPLPLNGAQTMQQKN